MDHFLKNIYLICYNIASVLRFGFLAMRRVASWLPALGLIAYPPCTGRR